ncbi:MAG: DUF6340 family protein [Flavobacteriaceae bacterium]
MKRLNLLAHMALISFCLMGCSATNNLTMGVTEPATVVLSPDVRTIGIINRSLPSEANQKADQIDKILSIEGLQLDQQGSEASLQALKNALLDQGIVEEVKILNPNHQINKGLGIWPASLSWDIIDNLCAQHEVDAIFSLAFYDTDTQIDYRATSMLLPNNLGIKVAVPAHELTLHTKIKNGWRVYDAKQGVIADELQCNDQVVSVGKGINPVKAYEAIAGRKEAVLQYSTNMGSDYVRRLQPLYKRISREYYVRGSHNFTVARRRAQTGDWQGAAALWEQEINNTNPKIAGRAYYNMAISNEINGDLEKAMDWASKAYSDYNNKLALRYLNALKYRSTQVAALERQISR